MTRKLAVGIAAALIALLIAAFGLTQWRGGSSSVSAQEVAQRAELAQSKLLDNLSPDSTAHVVKVQYRPQAPAPQRTRQEFWAYFGSDGQMARFVSETRDEATSAVTQTSTWAGGTLVIVDAVSGETRTYKTGATTVSQLRDTITGGQTNAVDLVAPDGAAPSANIDSTDTYVVDSTWGEGIERTYIDKIDYRTVRWERLDSSGTIVESQDTPTFEFLPGDAAPAAAPTAASSQE